MCSIKHVVLVGKPERNGPPVGRTVLGKVGINKSDTADCSHLASDSIKDMNFSHSAKKLQDLQFGASGYKYLIH